jgi:hypothetical protein
MAPAPAPMAVLCPCDDMPEQAPRLSKAATTTALSETLCLFFMELTPWNDLV